MTRIKEAWIVGAEVLLEAGPRLAGSGHVIPAQPAKEAVLDGIPLIDAHVHAARCPPSSSSGAVGAERRGRAPRRPLYDEGHPRPARFRRIYGREGVDVAVLFCEYSPKSTGIQPVEDLIPLLSHNPERFKLMANLNPHLHFPWSTSWSARSSSAPSGSRSTPSMAPSPPTTVCSTRPTPTAKESSRRSTAARASSRARRTATPTLPSSRTSPATSPTSP